MLSKEKKKIDLGDEECHEIEFVINGVSFSVFPLDELEIIDKESAANDETGKPADTGPDFWKICQSRLAAHGVKASLMKSGQWYTAMYKAYEDQLRFFAESLASSDSTGSVMTGEGQTNSEDENSGSLKKSATASRRRKSRKTS